ncbi:MAG: hypothetical protein ABJJ43_16885, partial [Ekhidna sp.]
CNSKIKFWNKTFKSSNQYSNAQIPSLSVANNSRNPMPGKRHSSRIQSGKTAFSAELVKRYSVEYRRLSTVISWELPSPNATGVYRQTIIIIRIVSSAHARKDQLTNSARLQLPTHPREVYSITCY